MITMTEIARLTNVSQPTVSRVLNGNMNVAPEIRERVLACAKEHDYQVNVLAKGLKGNKTDLIGVLLTDISNSFFAALAKELEMEARKGGYSIILFNSDYNLDKEQMYIDVVRRYQVDGVLAVPIQLDGKAFREGSKKLDVPIVSITRNVSGMDSVYVNHIEAGSIVAQHLVERGYERFLFVGKDYDRKYLGFRKALTQSGKAEQTTNLEYHSDEQLSVALWEYIQSSPVRAGIFVWNDIHALHVLNILRKHDISVPQHVGIIGFDDTHMARYLNPALSTVSQPIAQMAQEAVSRLIYRIDHPGKHPVWNLPLNGTLVIREST